MQKLYCDNCSNYLMGGDGECHDCPCGWKQPIKSKKDHSMSDDDKLVLATFLGEPWAAFEYHCEQSGNDAQAIYESLGGED